MSDAIATVNSINSLSAGGYINSTDKLFIFSNLSNDVYSINKLQVDQLSSLFINFKLLEQIKNKYNELQRLSANFKQFLKENYILSNKINTIYSNLEYFETVYRYNNTMTTVVSNELGDYASKAYANRYKEYAFSEIAKAKCNSGKSRGTFVTMAPGW